MIAGSIPRIASSTRSFSSSIGHTAKLDELAAVVNRHDLRLQDLTTDVAGLRETLTHYHATVLGHGILYSELEERVRRIERHLRLEPAQS